MNVLLILIPAALVLGLIGLGAFLWALRSGQFEDLDGASQRILIDETEVDPGSDGDTEPDQVRPTTTSR